MLAESKELDQILFDGMYPAIWAGKNKASLFYPSYVKTYIEKDVRDFLKIKEYIPAVILILCPEFKE